MKCIVPVLLVGVLFCSCKNNKNQQVNFSSDFLSRFYYKAGSYWIFKDSATGEIDSMYLKSSVLGFGLSGGNNAQTLKLFFIQVHSVRDTPVERLTLQMYALASCCTGNYLFDGTLYLDENMLIQYDRLFVGYPFELTPDAIIHNYPTIAGLVFPKVLNAHITQRVSDSVWYKNDISYGEREGIVKMRLNCQINSQLYYKVFDLVRFKVVI
jgi:hypothetical protein